MIDIKSIVIDAVNDLNKYGLPEKGLLAGGSLANTIWGKLKNKDIVINDIDIFSFVENNSKTIPIYNRNNFDYISQDSDFVESYNFLEIKTSIKDFYKVKKSTRDGLLNLIECDASDKNYNIIIDSFDLNCVQIGYDLETGDIYYSDNFIEFLESGEIKIVNVNTPSHTLVRLAKKKVELGATYNMKTEFEIIKMALYYCGLRDIMKLRFQEKYYETYLKYEDQYKDHFKIKRDTTIENYLKENLNIEKKLWLVQDLNNFNDTKLIRWVMSTKDIIKFVRLSSEKNKSIWNKVGYLFSDTKEYVDTDISKEDLDLLEKVTVICPTLVRKLRGYKLSEQIKFVKKFTDEFGLIDGSLIMEKNSFDADITDNFNKIIYELSIRPAYKTPHKIRRIENLLKNYKFSS